MFTCRRCSLRFRGITDPLGSGESSSGISQRSKYWNSDSWLPLKESSVFGYLKMSRRCIGLVWMPPSCCMCDHGSSVSKINRSWADNSSTPEDKEPKNNVSFESQSWCAALCSSRCWPVRADVKTSCHGSKIYCKLQCLMLILELNFKTTMIKNVHPPQGVVPLFSFCFFNVHSVCLVCIDAPIYVI